jgi:hypothetical protein
MPQMKKNTNKDTYTKIFREQNAKKKVSRKQDKSSTST